MIYLIGGAPRCGKTTFAKMLGYEKRIPGISTDLLESAIKPYMNDVQSFNPGNVCKDSPELLLRGEIHDAELLWPGVQRLIMSLLKWKHDYIIEGVHLLPELVNELQASIKENELKDQIRIVYLLKNDEQKIKEGLQIADPASDWLLQCIKTENDLNNAIAMIKTKSEYIENGAKKYGYKIVNTENNFKATLENLLRSFN